MFANMITNIASSSSVFRGSLIGYTNQFKKDIIGVKQSLIKQQGIHSEKVALKMAYLTKSLTKSNMAVSFVGNPYPTFGDKQKTRYCYIAIVFDNDDYIVSRIETSTIKSIEDFKTYAVKIAIKKIIKGLSD